MDVCVTSVERMQKFVKVRITPSSLSLVMILSLYSLRCCVVWCGMVLCGMVMVVCGMVWCDVVLCVVRVK